MPIICARRIIRTVSEPAAPRCEQSALQAAARILPLPQASVASVLDSLESSLYNAPALFSRHCNRELGAQVAQLVEHVTENHGVGGSIPPLGTTTRAIRNRFNHLACGGTHLAPRWDTFTFP